MISQTVNKFKLLSSFNSNKKKPNSHKQPNTKHQNSVNKNKNNKNNKNNDDENSENKFELFNLLVSRL